MSFIQCYIDRNNSNFTVFYIFLTSVAYGSVRRCIHICSKPSITLLAIAHSPVGCLFSLGDAVVLCSGEIFSPVVLGPSLCSKKPESSQKWMTSHLFLVPNQCSPKVKILTSWHLRSFTTKWTCFCASMQHLSLDLFPFSQNVILSQFSDSSAYVFVSFSEYCWTISEYLIDFIIHIAIVFIEIIDYFALKPAC